MGERDRKALVALGVCVVAFSAVYFWPGEAAGQVDAVKSVAQMEARVTRLRRLAGAAPAREEVLKKVQGELVKREKGMIVAETAAQAQAQVLQVVRRVATAQQPAVQFKGIEFGAPRAFGEAYGEVVMTVSLDGGIEQVVNLLADVANQPELVSVADLQMGQVMNKQKQLPVRITFTAVVPRRLVPEKKGGAF